MAWDNLISRTVWLLIQPSNFLLFILCAGLFLLWKGRMKWGKRLTLLPVVCFLLVLFTPLASWLMIPLENRFSHFTNQHENGPYSGIIILAGSERTHLSYIHNQAIFTADSERLTEAATLARLYPALSIIHTGGGGNKGEWHENDVARRFFQDAGIDLSRIRFEGQSYNTHTNAQMSRKLIKEDEKHPWLLVTSAYHMPRSVAAFRQAGISIQPYPAGYFTDLKYTSLSRPELSKKLRILDLAVHEWVGLFSYYLTGRSSALFPEPQSQD